MTDFIDTRLALARAQGANAARVEVSTEELTAIFAALAPKPKAERREKRRGTPEDEKCAKWLFGLVMNMNASAKAPSSWHKWTEDVRLMREQDGRTHREICELFQWANGHHFHRSKILCPEKLRARWLALDQERKDQAPRKPPGSPKFNFPDVDRSSDAKAAAASAKRNGIAVPDGEIEF